jgi:hypothetical protein
VRRSEPLLESALSCFGTQAPDRDPADLEVPHNAVVPCRGHPRGDEDGDEGEAPQCKRQAPELRADYLDCLVGASAYLTREACECGLEDARAGGCPAAKALGRLARSRARVGGPRLEAGGRFCLGRRSTEQVLKLVVRYFALPPQAEMVANGLLEGIHRFEESRQAGIDKRGRKLDRPWPVAPLAANDGKSLERAWVSGVAWPDFGEVVLAAQATGRPGRVATVASSR